MAPNLAPQTDVHDMMLSNELTVSQFVNAAGYHTALPLSIKRIELIGIPNAPRCFTTEITKAIVITS